MNAKISAALSMTLLLLSIVLVIATSGRNVRAEESSSSEVSAASGSNRFVVWADNTPGNTDIFFRRSTDNGGTWKPVVNLSDNPGGSSQPRISVSGSNVYVAWVQGNVDGTSDDIFFRRSVDNGATWGSKLKITQSGAVGYTLAKIAASGNFVYVLWDNDKFDRNGDVFLRRSTDKGATWMSIVNLSSNPGDSILPQIAVSGSSLYVVWIQQNSASTSTDAYFRRSVDNGATWGSKINLSNSGTVDWFDGNPRLAASGSDVYVVWPDRIDPGFGYTDVAFRRSTDNGATWQPVENLSNTPEEFTVKPRIAVSGPNVYVAWQDNYDEQDQDINGDIYFRRSTDNGQSWEPVIDLGHGYDPAVTGDRISTEIAASGFGVYVIWTNGGSWKTINLLVRASGDNGATWGSLVDLTPTSSTGYRPEPVIAASGSSVYVLWNQKYIWVDIFFWRSANGGATWNSGTNLSENRQPSFDPQIGL